MMLVRSHLWPADGDRMPSAYKGVCYGKKVVCRISSAALSSLPQEFDKYSERRKFVMDFWYFKGIFKPKKEQGSTKSTNT
jgi:hypothetical protein